MLDFITNSIPYLFNKMQKHAIQLVSNLAVLKQH